MLVLAVNCGSSTLKFRLVETDGDSVRERVTGHVDRVGPDARMRFGEDQREQRALRGHGDAMRASLRWLRREGLLDGLDAVGHRVVHGGSELVEPVLVDDAVDGAIERASAFAPLHNAPALEAIRAARDELGSRVPMVATFDTAFHATLPEHAWRYAIPAGVADRHGLRRFGFHGLAHRFMARRWAELTGGKRCITLQLGNGCSAAAVDGGRSVDTSMGLTPLEGLVMGTRSGDLDPALVGHLARLESLDLAGVDDLLNNHSGLRGLSGVSHDMRDVLDAASRGDARAAVAVEVFCYRARKYIGAYLAALGGAEGIVFGGGIGEHASEIRARILRPMAWCGVVLDDARNAGASGEARITADGSVVASWVVPVDEESIIARDVFACLRGS